MTVNDLLKRLNKMDKDKIVIYKEIDGGWDNIEIEEKEHEVEIMCSGAKGYVLFSEDK